MSIFARFTPASVTYEQYEQARQRLEDSGEWPPDGMEYHVCFGSTDNIQVNEVWDSQEQFAAFGERLMPVLADLGIDPGEPEVLEVQNIVRR
jgi:hypothetical protein